MEATNKSKKDIQKYIKKELASILTAVNPGIDKKGFKKSIKKAGKVLYRGSKRGKSHKKPVEVISTPA